MTVAYITAIISIVALLGATVLSFVKAGDLRYQLVYIVVATFNIGIIFSIILINYTSKSALFWPGIFLIMVFTKMREVLRAL